MNDYTEILRNSLQNEFSMAFDVRRYHSGGEEHYVFCPHNDGKELFNVDVHIANNIRIVLELTPQLHAASMLYDMEHASDEKKQMFVSYATALEKKGAKLSLTINGSPVTPKDLNAGVSNWRNLTLRVTKAPVIDEDDDNRGQVICEWSIMVTCMVLSLLEVVEITDEVEGKEEGNKYEVKANKYERNPLNRRLCLAIKGYRCSICGFDFEMKYGAIGHNFIHVHHIIPVSKMGPGYKVNPAVDLIPVCPNCHAMLHRKDPPYTPEEILEMIMDKYDIS